MSSDFFWGWVTGTFATMFSTQLTRYFLYRLDIRRERRHAVDALVAELKR